jgi:hypothetical protein
MLFSQQLVPWIFSEESFHRWEEPFSLKACTLMTLVRQSSVGLVSVLQQFSQPLCRKSNFANILTRGSHPSGCCPFVHVHIQGHLPNCAWCCFHALIWTICPQLWFGLVRLLILKFLLCRYAMHFRMVAVIFYKYPVNDYNNEVENSINSSN